MSRATLCHVSLCWSAMVSNDVNEVTCKLNLVVKGKNFELGNVHKQGFVIGCLCAVVKGVETVQQRDRESKKVREGTCQGNQKGVSPHPLCSAYNLCLPPHLLTSSLSPSLSSSMLIPSSSCFPFLSFTYYIQLQTNLPGLSDCCTFQYFCGQRKTKSEGRREKKRRETVTKRGGKKERERKGTKTKMQSSEESE